MKKRSKQIENFFVVPNVGLQRQNVPQNSKVLGIPYLQVSFHKLLNKEKEKEKEKRKKKKKSFETQFIINIFFLFVEKFFLFIFLLFVPLILFNSYFIFFLRKKKVKLINIFVRRIRTRRKLVQRISFFFNWNSTIFNFSGGIDV